MPRSPTAIEMPVKDIFSSSFLLNIPGYQRPYSWAETQTEELLDDLLDFLRANPETSPQSLEQAPTYFLGSIVLIKEKDKPEATVVDGQQRLTTLTLLLSCIRSTLSMEAARSINEFIYETGNAFKKLPDRFRLELRPIDAAFFRCYVQQPEPGIRTLITLDPSHREVDTDAKRNILLNAKLLMQRLAQLTPQQCTDLTMLIANRCYVVVVSTPDFNSAFRIFWVLNSRGLDLSPIDILKSRLLENVNREAPEKLNAITRSWEDMEVDLGREGFSDLFTHIRSMFRKLKSKETLLDDLTSDLEQRSSVDFCENLLPKAKEAFESILSADYPHSETGNAVNVYLSWLNRLAFTQWVPPAIAFWVRHEKDGAAMLRFFKDLERLAYSMAMRGETYDRRTARFGSLTGAIESGADLWSAASPLQLSPMECWDTYDMLNGDFYLLVKSPWARKTILLKLDSLIAGGEATYDHPIISVEHVLPQTPLPDSDWVRWFPTVELRNHWTHKIGNLALLAKSTNSAACNYSFSVKKNTYFRRRGVATMALTVQVLAHRSWTPQIVKTRQEALVSVLEKHWRLQQRP